MNKKCLKFEIKLDVFASFAKAPTFFVNIINIFLLVEKQKIQCPAVQFVQFICQALKAFNRPFHP
jgi:hypothetical protein